MADRLRQNADPPSGHQDQPYVRVGGGKPRGRVPDRHQQPTGHFHRDERRRHDCVPGHAHRSHGTVRSHGTGRSHLNHCHRSPMSIDYYYPLLCITFAPRPDLFSL